MNWTWKSAKQSSKRRSRRRFERLEDRSLLAVASFAVNLYHDDGGVPGALMTDDTVEVGQTFFAQIVAREHDPGVSGLAGISLDIAWDADVLDVVESFDPKQAVTPNLPLSVGGRLYQDEPPTLPFLLDNRIRENVGHIEGLTGAAFPASGVGRPIGSDGDDRFVKPYLRGLSTTDDHFAWLHFRAEQAGEALLTMRQGGLSIATMPVSSLTDSQLRFETQVVTVIAPPTPAAEFDTFPADDLSSDAPATLAPPDTGEIGSVATASDDADADVPETPPSAESQRSGIVDANPETEPPGTEPIVNSTSGGDASTGSAPASSSPATPSSSSIWQNAVDPLDVDGTGWVAPVDVLIIANFLTVRLGDWELPSVQFAPPRYFDVNGDGRCTPQDALLVVNYLTFRAQPEAEGESASSIRTEIGNGSPAPLPAGSTDTANPVSERPNHVAASLQEAMVTAELLWAAKRETGVLSAANPAAEKPNHAVATLRDAIVTAELFRAAKRETAVLSAANPVSERPDHATATDVALRTRQAFHAALPEIEDILSTLASDWFRKA